MTDKPLLATDYTPEMTQTARGTLLYIATTLGDLLDQIVLVGGLVPSLIIPDRPQIPAHVGTTDVDLGLSLALLDSEQYTEVSKRLRRAGFEMDKSDRGNPTRQRWVINVEGKPPGRVDFLMQPSDSESKAGSQQDLEADFAATIIPGLHLAFQEYIEVSLGDRTIKGETATRKVQVCGPGAFIILKALAIRRRNEPKDSYDLHHVIRYYGESVEEISDRIVPLLNDPIAQEALGFLAEDFKELSSIGPSRAAKFLGRPDDVDFKADVRGNVWGLLRKCGVKSA